MIHRTAVRSLRLHAGILCAAAVVSSTQAARAAPPSAKERAACQEAYRTAQDHEKAGQLRAARDSLVGCGDPACGASLQRMCATEYTRLADSDIPTIVPVFTDANGSRRTDVQVQLDGQPIATKLDGREIAVDPGLHEVTFVLNGSVVASEKLLFVEGQRARPVVVSLRPAGAPPESAPAPAGPSPSEAAPSSAPPSPKSAPAAAIEPTERERHGGPPSALPWVLTGAGVVGLGVGALVVALGRTDKLSVTANVPIGVSVGAGVAAIGVVAWLFSRPHPESAEPETTKHAATAFEVAPLPSGAFAAVSRKF